MLKRILVLSAAAGATGWLAAPPAARLVRGARPVLASARPLCRPVAADAATAGEARRPAWTDAAVVPAPAGARPQRGKDPAQEARAPPPAALPRAPPSPPTLRGRAAATRLCRSSHPLPLLHSCRSARCSSSSCSTTRSCATPRTCSSSPRRARAPRSFRSSRRARLETPPARRAPPPPPPTVASLARAGTSTCRARSRSPRCTPSSRTSSRGSRRDARAHAFRARVFAHPRRRLALAPGVQRRGRHLPRLLRALRHGDLPERGDAPPDGVVRDAPHRRAPTLHPSAHNTRQPLTPRSLRLSSQVPVACGAPPRRLRRSDRDHPELDVRRTRGIRTHDGDRTHRGAARPSRALR